METRRSFAIVLDVAIWIVIVLYAVIAHAYDDMFSLLLLWALAALLKSGTWWFARRNGTRSREVRVPASRRYAGQRKHKHGIQTIKTRTGRTVCHRFRGQNTARTEGFSLDIGLHLLRFTFPPDVSVSIYLEATDRQCRATILSRTQPPDTSYVDIEEAAEYTLAVEVFGMAAINAWEIEIEPV